MASVCGNCVYFQDRGETEEGDRWGFCKRYPPLNLQSGADPRHIRMDVPAAYPKCWEVEWCGEWRHEIPN